MRICSLFVAGALMSVSAELSHAEVKYTAEHNAAGTAFKFKSVSLPAKNDAATKAKFTVVHGQRDGNGGELAVLHDGRVPSGEDQPSENFFFRAGTDGGRIQVDLGALITIKQVSTYSWHSATRAPQVYTLYAADSEATGFKSEPGKGTDPESCGWKRVASVDTRPKEGDGGGQHGVLIQETSGALGNYRYLLFDIAPTENRDAFGNTFYSEIDVIDATGPPLTTVADDEKPIVTSFEAEGGKYRFTLDATAAPDLMEWAEKELRPVVQEWYPKLVTMLPSDGFAAPTNVLLRFRNDMGGTPASAGNARINLNSGWFRRELKREARGSVVHEMVHVVQNYGLARRTNPNATRTPGWLVEGIPDYIRWFLYEPQSKGAEITERNLERAKYHASYRVTGNFLNWVVQKFDKEIVLKLNTAAREGRYTEQLWKDWTGKTVQELGDEWKQAHADRLSALKAKTEAEKRSPDAAAANGATDWRPLFKGDDLENWTQNGSARWSVKDGVIMGGQDGDPKRGGLLATKERFTDFELELEFMIDEHGKYNSGVYLRNAPGATGRTGYQVNIGRPAAQEFIGLYTDRWLAKGDETDSIRRKLDWNKLYIFAKGGHIKVRLNDVEIVDYTDAAPAAKFLQTGVIGLQTYGSEGHAGWVKFRNIRIRELN